MKIGPFQPTGTVYFSPSRLVPTSNTFPGTNAPTGIPVFAGKTVEDATTLGRALTTFREVVHRMWGYVLANPFSTGVLVLDVEMTHGSRISVSHGLGTTARFMIMNPRPLPQSPAPMTTIAVSALNPQPVDVDPLKQIAMLPSFGGAGSALVDVFFYRGPVTS